MELEWKDIRIIEQLESDGRLSRRKIAEKLDLSPSTVTNHFHRLEQDGVIKGFRPVLDYRKIGFEITAVIELEAESSKMEEIPGNLRDRERVLSFYEVTGPSDMILVCKFLDREDMNRSLKEIQKVDGVVSTETKIAVAPPKEYGRISLTDALKDRV